MMTNPMDDHDLLVRIDTKLDSVATGLNDHELRIRKLERIIWLATGVAAASGGAIGTLATGLVNGKIG
jgi:hypothetical protein